VILGPDGGGFLRSCEQRVSTGLFFTITVSIKGTLIYAVIVNKKSISYAPARIR
jgi:hypothetical protein